MGIVLLHADHVQACAETYIGLVEMGVGVIPGGGGTKEMAKRASDAYFLEIFNYQLLKKIFKYRNGKGSHISTRRYRIRSIIKK